MATAAVRPVLHAHRLSSAAPFRPAGTTCTPAHRARGQVSTRSARLDARFDVAQLDRRALLSAAAIAALAHLASPLAAAADEAAADEVKDFKGKAGFTFSYPSSWITGFNRGEQSGALALVGDFKTFETASVLNADLQRLGLPPEAAEKGDVKALAKALIEEARTVGSTMSFELVNEGTERKGGGNYIVFEYTLSICNGEIEEGLEGVRQCLGPNGDRLEPITRHLVASAAFRDGKAYLLTASAPVERWQQSAQQLRAVAESFQLE